MIFENLVEMIGLIVDGIILFKIVKKVFVYLVKNGGLVEEFVKKVGLV